MLSTELETLQSLFENYNLGMNVFRRAQGGRAGLRE
jgi:colicin import membrane protein